MIIKSLFCIFDGIKEELYTANSAFKMAKKFNAYARFIHISHDPGSYNDIYEGDFAVTPALIKKVEQENKQRLKQAKLLLKTTAAEYHIPKGTKPTGNKALFHFVNKTGNYDTIINEEGISSDLIMLWNDQENKDIMRRYYTIAALFNTGRPVLLLPSEQQNKNAFDSKIVSVAWDGSAGSARAIFYAMPLLHNAKKIYLITATDQKDKYALPESMKAYIAAHGLKPTLITLHCKDKDAAKNILAKTTELKSDLLVMGAFGHSRFRELILGGFTLYMLENSGTPLFLVN